MSDVPAGDDLGVAMMPGTDPAVTALPSDGYEVAFQGSNGDLWAVGTNG